MRRRFLDAQTLRWTAVAAAALVGTSSHAASTTTVTFDSSSSFVHGFVISNTTSVPGVQVPGTPLSVSVDNFGGTPDLAVLYDTQFGGDSSTGEDPDLEGPGLSGWSGGNVDLLNTILGNVLIIQERRRFRPSDPDPGDVITPSDDEGRRPAGAFTFTFDLPVESFGFTLVDIENAESNGGFFAAFYLGSTPVGTVTFGDLVDSGSAFYDPSIAFGDNTVNVVEPFLASDFGVAAFDQVVIGLGGSGGVDNVSFVLTPSPAAAGIGVLGLLGLVGRRRRA